MNIKVYIANSNFVVREGLKSLIAKLNGVEVVAEAENSKQLLSTVVDVCPDLILIDYSTPLFKIEDIRAVLNILPGVKVLAITELTEKAIIENALKSGVDGHILNCCDKQEITDAIYSITKGDRFFCGKVLDLMKDESFERHSVSCAPISLSGREMEVISHIAEGFTNKEIADKLFLSTHTVMTHRKNIMNKLGVNNTAGVVIYAVKENLISPNKFLFTPAVN
ncbi:MAG: hypothetical protein COA57_06465 [Flavobacteriales bacterium]|nr:response regulator transcription factor [Bacteroidales bacterium AH-315-I05]PCJ86157.1 MAG: hypothetical protein COA57_06465 [Flavobacteriales bacterium]